MSIYTPDSVKTRGNVLLPPQLDIDFFDIKLITSFEILQRCYCAIREKCKSVFSCLQEYKPTSAAPYALMSLKYFVSVKVCQNNYNSHKWNGKRKQNMN